MTIRKGVDWGTLQVPAPGLALIDSDAALRAHVVAARRAGIAPATVGLVAGEMMRTVGGLGDREALRGAEPIAHLPIDIVRLVADDIEETWFVSHCVTRNAWLRGPVNLAMNAQFLRNRDVAPRSHPNDGRLDVVQVAASMPVRQRLMAARRAKLGTHLPHPDIAVRSVREMALTLPRGQAVWVDGERWRTARALQFTVEPDALIICV